MSLEADRLLKLIYPQSSFKYGEKEQIYTAEFFSLKVHQEYLEEFIYLLQSQREE